MLTQIITVLCYWGISFYFLISALHTFTYALHGGTPLLNRFPRPLQALHYLFYTTIVTYPFLVTIVYWAILYSSFATTFALWSNISQHAMNSIFGLFELVFSRINPSPWIHLLWLIILLGSYCGLAYLTYATKHYYVYNFLNPNPPHNIYTNGVKQNLGGVGKGAVVGYVLGIAAAIIVIFCVSKGLQWVRKWATERKGGMKGRFYAGRGMGMGEVELETQRVWAVGWPGLAIPGPVYTHRKPSGKVEVPNCDHFAGMAAGGQAGPRAGAAGPARRPARPGWRRGTGRRP